MSEVTATMVKELREMTGAGMMECKKALTEASGDMQLAVDNMRKSGQAKAAKRAGRIAAEGAIVMAINDDCTLASMLELNCETDFVARDTHFKSFSEALAQAALLANANDVETLMAQKTADGTVFETMRESLVSKIGENIQVRRVVTLTSSGCVGVYVHGDRIGVIVALDKHNPDIAKDVAMHIAATNPLAIDASGVSQEVLAKEREIVTVQAQASGKPDNIVSKMVEGRLQKYIQEVCLIHQPFIKNTDQTVQQLLQSAGVKVLAFKRFEVGEGIEKPVTDLAKEVSETLKGTH